MSTLYELTGKFNLVAEMLADDLDNELFVDTLESIDAAIEDKAENYAKLIRNLETNAIGLKAEIERLQTRKASIDNNVERLKTSLQEAMEATNKSKFKTSLFSFNIQNNPQSIFVDDESLIDEKYFIPQLPKLDKAAIKDAIKNGEEVVGAHLVQTRGLRIR